MFGNRWLLNRNTFLLLHFIWMNWMKRRICFSPSPPLLLWLVFFIFFYFFFSFSTINMFRSANKKWINLHAGSRASAKIFCSSTQRERDTHGSNWNITTYVSSWRHKKEKKMPTNDCFWGLFVFSVYDGDPQNRLFALMSRWVAVMRQYWSVSSDRTKKNCPFSVSGHWLMAWIGEKKEKCAQKHTHPNESTICRFLRGFSLF